MPTLFPATADAVLAAVSRAGHAVFDQTRMKYNLQIVGFRSSLALSNRFDDQISVVFHTGDRVPRVWSWPVTTDPGTYWVENPGRVAGVAVLKAGQYRGAWQLGLHKGEKPALVQVKPVTVWRDNNRNALRDTTVTETGLFGINIHRAGLSSTQVDKWSAGCQVFQKDADFEEFLGLCRLQAANGPGWDRFSYTLLENW